MKTFTGKMNTQEWTMKTGAKLWEGTREGDTVS
jgi:hypothetical protein